MPTSTETETQALAARVAAIEKHLGINQPAPAPAPAPVKLPDEEFVEVKDSKFVQAMRVVDPGVVVMHRNKPPLVVRVYPSDLALRDKLKDAAKPFNCSDEIFRFMPE